MLISQVVTQNCILLFEALLRRILADDKQYFDAETEVLFELLLNWVLKVQVNYFYWILIVPLLTPPNPHQGSTSNQVRTKRELELSFTDPDAVLTDPPSASPKKTQQSRMRERAVDIEATLQFAVSVKIKKHV